LRPLALRFASILRPFAVAIRLRKPCRRFLTRLLGWNVRFTDLLRKSRLWLKELSCIRIVCGEVNAQLQEPPTQPRPRLPQPIGKTCPESFTQFAHPIVLIA